MTNKSIKNEQWTVNKLMSKINKQEISKPKFQRKKKWNLLPRDDDDNTPNEQTYIKFLYDTENSVHAITFGQETNSQKNCFSNIVSVMNFMEGFILNLAVAFLPNFIPLIALAFFHSSVVKWSCPNFMKFTVVGSSPIMAFNSSFELLLAAVTTPSITGLSLKSM